MYLKTSLLFAVLASVAIAGPTRQKQSCAAECNPQTKFFYETGRKYEYYYEAETHTQLTNVFDESAILKVTALVSIQPVSPCEYALTLSEISLEGSSNSDAFSDELSRKSLRFAFQNGKIDQICIDPDEAVWATNFKKGILSTLQNSMGKLQGRETVTETDVSGICETSYSATKEGSTIFVERSKIPSDCSNSPQSTNKLSSFGYSIDSLVQGLPIMNSNQHCKQEISEDIIKNVKCEETHLFRPFSNQQTGATTMTFTSLKLKEVKSGSPLLLDFSPTRTELLYDHSETQNENSALDMTENVLSRLNILSENGVRKEVPALFSELVTSLRGLSQPQIQQLYERTDILLKKFLIDALPLVGTPSSMQSMVYLILNKDISPEDANIWFTSLAFIKNPSIDMFSAILPLLESSANTKILLGISSLVHNYCLKDNECESKFHIQKVLRNIESRIGIGCRATSEEEKTNILYALKALGNAGRFVNAEHTLQRCYLEENPMEVRIAAIEAWRRVPCTYNMDHMLNAYSDQNQDTEIRIASYLALMNCPTKELIDTVKDRLTSEGVNQVGSFVWTHLTNLQESAAPEKQWIRQLIGEDIFQKKFSKDALKFSKYFESSFFLKEQNFGANAEGNVIFSSGSFLPRSTMFNLTIDLFGESINLFEVGGRIEGFEAYIEKFFGPNGYYPEETIEAVIKNLREKNSKDETTVSGILADQTSDPEGSYYFKILGNELVYRHFHGIEGVLPELGISNPLDLIKELLKNNNVDITKNYNLINSEYNFPTITGFPVNLKLNGTATVSLKINGNFKFDSLNSIDIQGKLQPSAAVQIDGSMAVNAFVTKSGMKFVSTLHTSTAVEGKIVVEGGKVADLTINVPNEKVEIFDITNEFFKIENEKIVKEISQNKEINKCIPVLFRSLGMEICYEQSVSVDKDIIPRYPLSGPFKMQLYLKKTDTHSSYMFHYTNDQKLTSILLNMPGSSSDKKWTASLNRANENFELDIYSPFGSANGKVILDLPNANIGVEGEMILQDKSKYGVKFNFRKQVENTLQSLQVEFVSTHPKGEICNFKGKTEFDGNTKSFDLDAAISGNMVPTASIKFTVDRKNTDNSAYFKIASAPLEINLSGFVSPVIEDGLMKLDGSYRFLDNPTKTLNALVKYQKKDVVDGTFYSASVDIKELEFNTDLKLKLDGTNFDGKIFGQYKHISWDVKKSFNYIKSNSTQELKMKAFLSIPSANVEYSYNKRTFLSDKKFLIQYDINGLRNGNFSHEVVWNFGKDFTFSHSDSGNILAMNIAISKLAEGSYNLQIQHEIFGDKSTMQATLINRITSVSINSELKMSLDHKGSICSVEGSIDGNMTQLNIKMNLSNNGKITELVAKATPSSLYINSDIIEPISFKANIESEGESKQFKIESTIKSSVYIASGSFSPQNMEGFIKLGETEAKLIGKLQPKGIEIIAEWSPNKRFSLQASYNIGKEISLYAGIETPFQDWEKQEVNINLRVVDNEIKGQISLTWKNIHHIGITLESKFVTRPSKTNLTGSIRVSSTLENFERAELTLKHTVSDSTINTKFELSWNSEKIKGKLDAFATENGYKLDASLTTPFTKEFTASFNHNMSPNDISTTLDVSYGSSKSRIIIKGNKIDVTNMNGSVICSSPFLPEMSLDASIQMSSPSKTLEIKGKFNGQKILLLANCETYVSNHENNCKMAMKFVTSSAKIFSFNYSNKISLENGFETDFDFNSIWLSNQNIKGHVEGKISSISSAFITGYLSGPSFSGMINLSHKIENRLVSSKGEVSFNTFTTKVAINGNVNLDTYEGTMNGEIESTMPQIDGCKLTIQHELQGKSRNSFIIFAKDKFNMKAFHSITIKDFLNWSNYITVNDIYSITNEMSSSANFLKHDTKITMGDKKASFSLETKYGDELEVKTSFDSSWTSSVQIKLNHKIIDGITHSKIRLDYGNGKTILANSEYKFGKKVKQVKITLTNEEWSISPLSAEIKVTNGDDKTLDVNMRFGGYFTAIIQLFKKTEERGGNVNLQVNRPASPISFVGKYLCKRDTKEIRMEYESESKYTVDLKIQGNLRAGNIVTKFVIPCLNKEPYTTTITYIFADQPFEITITSNVNQIQIYDIKCLFDKKGFSIEFKTPTKEGSLKINWNYEANIKTFNMIFVSPLTDVSNGFIKLIYEEKYQTKSIDTQIKYGIHEIIFNANLSDSSFEAKADTSIVGLEKLRMALEFNKSFLGGVLSKNDVEMQISAQGNLQNSRGEGEIVLTTPITGFENNKINLKYIISENKKEVSFTSNIGLSGVDVQYSFMPLDSSSKVLTFRAANLYNNIKMNSVNAVFENNAVNVDGSIDNYNFNWSFTNAKVGNGHNFTFTAASNIPGWRTFTAKTDINMVKQPYNVAVVIQREERTQIYSAILSYGKNNVEMEIISPIPAFENIKINGNLGLDSKLLKTSLAIRKNSENINLHGYIDFNTAIPQIAFTLLTPFSGKEIINFALKSNLIGMRTITTSLVIGETSYSVNILSKLYGTFGDAILNIHIPISVLSQINGDIKLAYNFENEVKSASFKVESENSAENYSFEGKLSSSEFSFEVETPIEGLKKLHASGKYEKLDNGFVGTGKYRRDSTFYEFQGKVVNRNGALEVEANFPINDYDNLVVTGVITKNKIHLKFLNENNPAAEEQEIIINYSLDYKGSSIKIYTPFDNLSYIALGGNLDFTSNKVDGGFFIHKNNQQLNFEGSLELSPMKSNLKLKSEISETKTIYEFQLFYDVLSEKKNVGIVLKNGKAIHKYLVEAFLQNNKPYQGYLKVSSTYPGYEHYGFEYLFANENNYSDIKASFAVFADNQKTSFGIDSKLNKEGLLFALNTPFTGYENIVVEGKIISLTKYGKVNITIGSYKLYFETLIAPKNSYVVIQTPYKILKSVNIEYKYGWEPTNKLAQFKFIYNDVRFELDGSISPSLTQPEIKFLIISPLGCIKVLEISGKYDIQSPQELFEIGFQVNDKVYKFSFGYLWENNRASVNASLTSPIVGWKSVKFSSSIDLENVDKIFHISLEKEGDPKAIFLSGKLVEGEIDFDVKAPLGELGNFKTSGSYSRSKRSVHFGMMNDDNRADIIASFNSFHVKIATPFKKAMNIDFELSKNNKGTWTLNYKRNNDAATVNIITQHKKKGIDVKIESEIPGWELLALAGRLDMEQIKGYISGQLNEEKMKISGEGTLADKQGTLSLTIDTPYDKYKQVKIRFDYNVKRNILSFNASSSSSPFKIFLEAKRDLRIEVFIPNATENTEIKGTLSAFNGEVKANSRFAFLKTLSFIYSLELSPKIVGKVSLVRNSIKHFVLDTSYDPETNLTHIMITGKLGENQSMIHFHREGWKKVEFIFKRNTKEFKINITGSGNLPLVGQLQFNIHNSFREVPKDLTGKLTIDRQASPKKITIQVDLPNDHTFQANLNYNADFGNIRKGDFTLKIITEYSRFAGFKDISGNWNFDQNNKGQVVLNIDPHEYKLHGTIGILQSDLIFEASKVKDFKYFLQWKFEKQGNSRSYFLKVGHEQRYFMYKLNGTFDTIFNGDVTGAFRASRFMAHDFEYTSKWSRSSEGLTSSGTFKFGNYNGTHKLINFKRNPEEKSATFKWEATSNINNFKHVVLNWEYNLKKRQIDFTLSWDTDKISLKGTLENFTLLSSQNSIFFHLPGRGDGEATLSHDFTNPLAKSIKMIGTVGGKKISYVINWTRNEDLTKLDLNIDIDSGIFGKKTLHAGFDFINLRDATASIHLKREGTELFALTWSRKVTADSLKSEIIVQEQKKQFAHFLLTATWVDGFKVESVFSFHNLKIESKIDVGANKATAYIKTPFPGFQDINVNVDYNFTGKSKTVVFKYARGERVIDLKFDLTIVKKNGSIKLTLTTPFEVLKSLSIDGEWKKGKFNAVYQRNDVTVDFKGTADVKIDKSSFNIKFTPPNHKLVELQFAYDLESFVKGDGKVAGNLIDINLNIDGHKIEFKVNGYRNPDKINIEIAGSTSLEKLSNFYLKLDSELNLNNRAGFLEIRVNDFHFKMNNSFEKRKNGFYARSQIDSSATSLPGLTIGFGREGESLIVTFGYGDEREISFTFKGRDAFKKGFVGKIDIPRRGLHNLEFDVKYGFKGEDKIQVVFEVTLGEGRKIEADFVYNSEGVKARLSSPWTGLHRARARRSISDDYFLADIGVDNYSMTLEGDYKTNPFKKGFRLEGEIFGKKFALNSFFNINTISNSEGKLIVETPFAGYERLGGFFKINKSKNVLVGEGEFYLLRKISMKLNMNFEEITNGEISMSIDELMYKISCNFLNTNTNIRGELLIETPHTIFDKASVKGSIDFASLKFIQGSLVVTSPLWSGDVNFAHSNNDQNSTLDISFDSKNSKKYALSVTYSFIKDPFYLKFGTNFHDNGKITHTSSVEISFNHWHEFHTFIEYAYNEKDISSSLNIQVTKNFIKGELIGKITKEHQLNLSFNVPAGMRQVIVNVRYNGKQNHVLRVELTKEVEYHEIMFDINSPLITKGTLKIFIYESSKITLDANFLFGKIYFTVENTLERYNSSDKHLLAKLDIEFPETNNKYSAYIRVLNSSSEKEIKINFVYKEITHTLLGKWESNENGLKIQLMADTPFLNINNANLIVSYNFRKQIEVLLENNYKYVDHSFFIRIDGESNYVILNIKCPAIPTGMAKLEGSYRGSALSDMEVNVAISNAENTISSDLIIKWDTSRIMNVAFDLRTPFEDYKKTKIGLNYSKTDISRVSMFVEPFGFDVETYFGVQNSIYSAGAKVNSEIENWKANSIDIHIPLNKFEPKISVVVSDVTYELTSKLNQTEIGGEFSIFGSMNDKPTGIAVSYRSKAPFEFGYNIEYYSMPDPIKFHVMFDSSFVEIFGIFKHVPFFVVAL